MVYAPCCLAGATFAQDELNRHLELSPPDLSRSVIIMNPTTHHVLVVFVGQGPLYTFVLVFFNTNVRYFQTFLFFLGIFLQAFGCFWCVLCWFLGLIIGVWALKFECFFVKIKNWIEFVVSIS